MSNPEQDEYLKRRAAQERVAAKLAEDERAALAHAELAQKYEVLVAGTGQQAVRG